MASKNYSKSGLFPVGNTDNPNLKGNVVFVHGLGGDPLGTWTNGKGEGSFWPQWIADDFPDLGVWTLGYEAEPSAWKNTTMPIPDMSRTLLERLASRQLHQRPLVFITHSLGGLMVKQMLLNALDLGVSRWEAFAAQTKGIAFIATPHRGSGLANFVVFVGKFLRLNENVKELQGHETRLRDLHTRFLAYVVRHPMKCRAYAESKPPSAAFLKTLKVSWTLGNLVVNAESAEPNLQGEVVVPLEEDHFSICKPRSRDSDLYQSIAGLLNDCRPPVKHSHQKRASAKTGAFKNSTLKKIQELLAPSFMEPFVSAVKAEVLESGEKPSSNARDLVLHLVGMAVPEAIILFTAALNGLGEKRHETPQLHDISESADSILGWLILLCVDDEWILKTGQELETASPGIRLNIPVRTKIGAETAFSRLKESPATFNALDSGRSPKDQRLLGDDEAWLETGPHFEDSVVFFLQKIWKRFHKGEPPTRFDEHEIKTLDSRLKFQEGIKKPLFFAIDLKSGQHPFLDEKVYGGLKEKLKNLNVIFYGKEDGSPVLTVAEPDLEGFLMGYFDQKNELLGDLAK